MSTPNEAASWVARSRMELGTVLSLAMRREQLAGLLALALLGERERGHFPGAAEPRLARLGEGLKPGNHLLRLELVELERRLADERGIAIRLRQPAVGGVALVFRDRGLDVALLDRSAARANIAEARTPLLPLSASWSSFCGACAVLPAPMSLNRPRKLLDLRAGRCRLVLPPPDQAAARGEEQYDAAISQLP